MIFKKTIRKYISKRFFDLAALLIAFPVVGSWVQLYQNQQYGNFVPWIGSDWFMRATLIETGVFLLLLYYGADSSMINRIVSYYNKNLVKEIDEQIINALVLLRQNKKEITTMITNSNKYDDNSKKVVLDKLNIIISRTLDKIKKAETLRNDARRIPHLEVKKRLLEIREYLIAQVSTNIKEVGEIRDRVNTLENDPHLKKAQLDTLEKELDLKIKISEKKDETIKNPIYNNRLDTAN